MEISVGSIPWLFRVSCSFVLDLYPQRFCVMICSLTCLGTSASHSDVPCGKCEGLEGIGGDLLNALNDELGDVASCEDFVIVDVDWDDGASLIDVVVQ